MPKRRANHRIDDRSEQVRFEAYLNAQPEQGKAVIFDIGTRAVRVLCGSKQLPRVSWGKNVFFNDGTLSQLGEAISKSKILDPRSPAVARVIDFINIYRPIFLRKGGDATDCLGFGTAVFRWLENRDAVLDYIYEKTKLRIHVLSQAQEAQLSLLGLIRTYQMRRKQDSPVLSAGDALLLLDQGGGSLEVSYFLPGEKKRWNVHSFDDLGSVALRDRFFSLGSVKKKKLHNDIERKQERLIQYISKRLDLWGGYPVLHGRKVHVYAMGSLASSMLRGNSYDIHNRQITKKFMLGKIKYNKRMLRKHYHSVSELYKVMQEEQMGKSNQMKSVSQRLLLTSGLPAYVGVLKRFQADAMQMCGYGLRYGVFIRLYEQDAQDIGMPPIRSHSG